MTIHVTKEHIEDGIKGSCASCPIALAIEPFNKVWYVSVTRLRDAYLAEDAERYVSLPDSARSFIHGFDNEIPVQPFSFNLSAECFML